MKKIADLRSNVLRLFGWVLSSLLCSIFFSPPAFADGFTAHQIGDYGNVTVMEVTGNYDAQDAAGAVNSTPRKLITTEFYKTHKDDYDFVVIFSNFDFKMPESEAVAFYHPVKNDTYGIGKDIFDNTGAYGSGDKINGGGKLQGTIDMGNLAANVADPLDPKFDFTLDTLSHELLHRWASYVKFKDASGNDSTALIGKGGAHWSFLLDSKGSLEYGNQWQDNGNGTFTSVAARKYYSPLDLYLMGMLDKSKVPPMLLIDNPSIDPARKSEVGVTISGTRRTVTIDDIIAAMGERSPGVAQSQKSFKTAFIFITQPGTFTGQELYGIENIRNGFLTRFSILTDGQGLVQVTATPKDNIPLNPGVRPPVVIPQGPLPPTINDGVNWLMTNQQTDGSWSETSQTTERDTAETVATLQIFPVASQQFQTGLTWLNGAHTANTDYLARRIEALVAASGNSTGLVQELVGLQNADGGWGSANSFSSSPTDTGLALKALAKAGFADQQVIGKGITYLKSVQNSDGGWSGDRSYSLIQPTASVLIAFNAYRKSYPLDDLINRGVTWLQGKQNSDGGFGNSPSTIYDSAVAIMALREINAATDVTDLGVAYLGKAQSADGSWYGSPYQTALALRAVWKATETPDLSIRAEDVSIIPATLKSLPTNAVISATIRNLGRTDVPLAKVVLYDGAIVDTAKIGEQMVAFPALTPVTVTFSITVPDGAEHHYYIVVDPDNAVKESKENNNVAIKVLSPEATYDFEILPGGVTVSQNPVDMAHDVKIAATISNKGTMNAYNVQARYFIDEPGAPFEIATATVDIPSGATITKEITWRTNRAGLDLPVTVQVDPLNSFVELSKDNNKAFTPLTVNSSTLPNLSTFYKDIVITPSPANENGSATIATVVRNEGFSAANNVKVTFYKGMPSNGGTVLGSQIIASISAGGSAQVSINWTNINDAGERTIYIAVDPENYIQEVSEDDNTALVSLNIRSIPDLAVTSSSIIVSPAAPRVGDMASIALTVQNRGQQDAENVQVKLSEGTEVIGTSTISLITGNSQVTVTFPYVSNRSGGHVITATVDPANLIVERSKDNNSATKSFGIQNSNFWLSEQYISPNGDGVKDTTEFSFRLENPATVKVQILNNKDKVIRTFEGGDLDNTAGAVIIWDGKSENGLVVDDGEYRITLIQNDSVLASLNVVVDTNRTPLIDAIGTDYLAVKNLTCTMPTYEEWDWLANDQGIALNLEAASALGSSYTPQYTGPFKEGIYNVSMKDAGTLKLTPWDYFTYPPDRKSEVRLIVDQTVSPDKGKIALVIEIKKVVYSSQPYPNRIELWTVDADGSNLTLLATHTVTYTDYWFHDHILNLKWSPDSKKLLYEFYRSSGNINTFYETDVQNKIVKQIDTNTNFVLWSDDSTKYYYYKYVAGKNNLYEVINSVPKIVNMANEYGYANGDKWLIGNKALLNTKQGMMIVDVSTGQTISLIGYSRYELSFDKRLIYVAKPEYPIYYWYVYDLDGNLVTSNDTEKEKYKYIYNIWDAKWSKDGRVASIASISTNQSYNMISIIDVNAKSERILQLPNLNINHILSWYANDSYLIISDNNLKIYIVNIDTGEYTPVFGENQILGLAVSPNENNFVVSQSVKTSDGCYQGYHIMCFGWQSCANFYKSNDLWSVSSLLNLVSELNIIKNQTSVTIKGTASDKNFDRFTLEYVDVLMPSSLTQIIPESHAPIIDGTIADWLPPYKGTFEIRLTVYDKAGNVNVVKKRISWGIASTISNVYKSTDFISPNNDGIKDEIEIHFNLSQPGMVELIVTDKDNRIINTVTRTLDIGSNLIKWDGKDANGNVVKDGTYNLAILNNIFTVTVDTTIPAASISLTPITDDISTKLYALASDDNLENWKLEYGEGENPTDWVEMHSGYEPLSDTNPLLEIKNYQVNAFDYVIPWVVNKKCRITAIDKAGNKVTKITGFLEEKLSITGWQNSSYDPNTIKSVSDSVPANLTRPGKHYIESYETVRSHLHSINLQYATTNELSGSYYWHTVPDSEISYYDYSLTAGRIGFIWDNSKTATDAVAVRLIAIDDYDQQYISKELGFLSAFNISYNGCNLSYTNILKNRFKKLNIQVKSQKDPDYAQWVLDTTVKCSDLVDTCADGNAPPEFEFQVPLQLFQKAKPGIDYQIRMVGIDEFGKERISNAIPWPPRKICDENKFKLSAKAVTGECNTNSSKIAITPYTEDLGGTVYDYSIKIIKQSDGSIIKVYKYDSLSGDNILLDTASYSTGVYIVVGAITYYDDNINAEVVLNSSTSFVIEKNLPLSQITYPNFTETVCSSTNKIPIEAKITDDGRIVHYELLYGYGTSPQTFQPISIWNITGDADLSNSLSGDSIQGTLGYWNNGINGTYVIRLKAIDAAGNVGCYDKEVSINFDTGVGISSFYVDNSIISPNNDGYFDVMKGNFQVAENAVLNANVYKLMAGSSSPNFSAETKIKTLFNNKQHINGNEYLNWDGTNNEGTKVPDGSYAVVVEAADSCLNNTTKYLQIKVDTTKPTAIIAAPTSATDLSIGNLVEIKGTANDVNFKSYTLEIGEGENPSSWTSLGSSETPVDNNILGTWNTFGLQGRWTIRLSVEDKVGNKDFTTVTIDVGTRKSIIKSLTAVPKVISPNHDGNVDSSLLSYELTDQSDITINITDASGAVVGSIPTETRPAGGHAFTWDGTNNTGAVVGDGIYYIKLKAVLLSNSAITQEEHVAVIVDTVAPAIDFNDPVENAFLNRISISPVGSINDTNLSEYTVSYTAAGVSGALDSGKVNKADYTFGTINDLIEGTYTITVVAKDQGWNERRFNRNFTIDRTPPKVTLDAPKDHDYFGFNKNVVEITGAITEKNLDRYSLRYGLGDSPTQWVEISGGDAIPLATKIASWKVGKTDNIADGLYTVSLYAKDKAGLEGEFRVKVIVDNTIPQVGITLPKNGDYVRGTLNISGTAYDANLDKATIEIAENSCENASKWLPIKILSTSVQGGLLASWQVLPSDGLYCLRLSALDKVGQITETQVSIKIDNHAPASPVLSGQVQNKSDVHLSWTQNSEPDFVGYNIYGDGQKINGTLLTDASFSSANIPDGERSYTVTAVDLAGNESLASNVIRLRIDSIGPSVRITAPLNAGYIRDLVDIKGSTYSPVDFKQYRVFIGQGRMALV